MIKQPIWLLAVALSALPATAKADSVCGPGKRMVDNQWACGPDNGARRSSGPSSYGGNNAAARVAAGVALGGALFSIIESLASQSRMTDNVSSMVSQIEQQHKNRSVEYNRQGLALQQAGRFNEARIAFLKAANEALSSGDGGANDSMANSRNAAIADALHWLKQGYNAERAGQKNKANISYQTGLQVARQAGIKDFESKLKSANDQIIRNNSSSKLIRSEANCSPVNGKLACQN